MTVTSPLQGDIESAIHSFWNETRSRYNFLKSDRERPVLAPETIFLTRRRFLL